MNIDCCIAHVRVLNHLWVYCAVPTLLTQMGTLEGKD